MESSPSPWDGQGLPGEVGGRGVDMFILDVDVVGGEDGFVPRILRESSFSIPWIPRSCGIVGVANGVSIWSLTPWVCSLGTPYMPCRGAWVLKFGCWGAASCARPRGIISGRELLLTRVVLVGGGILNRDRSPVKGTGGGRCANGCQICADCWSLSLEAGDNIVGWEWGIPEVSSRDSSSAKDSQSLEMSADLLCIYEGEDENGDEGGGNGNCNAYTDQLEIS